MTSLQNLSRTHKILLIVGGLFLLGGVFYLMRLAAPDLFRAAVLDTSGTQDQTGVAPTAMCREIGKSSAQVVVTVGGTDVGITKTVSRPSLHIGEQAVYTLTYANTSNQAAEGVRIVDDYDETRLRIEANTLSNFCSVAQGMITCVLPGPLVQNASGTFTYTATATALGVAPNVATISSTTPDANAANNTARAQVNIIGNGPTCALTADPTAVSSGASSTLSWTINGAATSAMIDQDIGNVLDRNPRTIAVTPNSTTTYTLTVSSPEGTNTCSATVSVGSAPGRPTIGLTKQANPTLVRRGDTITYTLNYVNNGPGAVTNLILRDDYDEVRLTNVQVPASCIAAGGVIVCNLGGLQSGGTGQLTYTATVASTVENSAAIRNVAVLTSTETDPANAEATVNVRALILDKTVSPSTVISSQEVGYTVTVENTLSSAQSFTLRDVLTPVPDDANNNRGGRLDFIPGSVQVTFTPQSSGTFAGSTPDNFIVTNLAAGARVQIAYRFRANDQGIAFNHFSKFKNVVTLIETGDTDEAEVIIRGPTSGGGCQRNCGGGGGGGGGGPRITRENINLDIQKEIKDLKGVWQDADTIDLAAMVAPKTTQKLAYRIRVTNPSRFAAEKVEITDIFDSKDLKRVLIRNVKGADFNAEKNTFRIAKINPDSEVVISYEMLLVRKLSAEREADGSNTATITKAAAPAKLPARTRVSVEGTIGEKDSAFIVSNIPLGDVGLSKVADRAVARPGEEVNYTIRVANKSGQDLRGVILTDLFPFDHLEFISSSSRGIQREKTMEYRKNILRLDETWTIQVKARVKAAVENGTSVRNFVGISAENMDLSDKHAETVVIVERGPVPQRLIRTGSETFAFLFLIVGTGLVAVALRKRYAV